MTFNKKNIHSKSLMLFCTGIFSLMPLTSFAYLQGEVTTNGGPNIFYAVLDNTTFPNNRPGEIATVRFSLPQRYDGTVYCPNGSIDKRALTYFKATTDLPSVGNNFFQLNEYVDIRIKFEIWGPDPLPTVPFIDKENNRNDLQGCTVPSSPKPHISSGSSGELTFRLRKPIINGVSLSGSAIAQMYAMVSYRGKPSGYGSEPISKLIITSGIITTEDKCIFNNGAPITFDFGNVGNTSTYLNGQNYKITRNIPIKCEGGSFTNPSSKIMFKVQTGSSGIASFNSDYLGTTGPVDRSNLGIVLRDKSGIIAPNKYFSVGKLNNFTGSWEVTAAPIAKSGSNIPEGEFSAHATLVAEFM
ncbi:fimbrial protein [Proteus myxofaciens]|uniref:PmfE family putative minor fimbrial subunit n=1 Tax=Proteus myxofaciens ATCC 19692 TaxID=1354337 RepID=A0A198GDL8_9GAMM|nr:fimbrial protein [Proteus myxofaciens]OAT35188.1 PmfE family putative minor fimbrial subunit [Proteus myxofaciens ATCC 19692]